MMLENKPNKGQRNLVILGIGAICIACTSLLISLYIYRNSGDIYLDRSRPGFLPEEGETKEEKQEVEFIYSDSGALDKAELEEYLSNLEKILEQLETPADPYSASALSNESLGIPPEEKPKEAKEDRKD